MSSLLLMAALAVGQSPTDSLPVSRSGPTKYGVQVVVVHDKDYVPSWRTHRRYEGREYKGYVEVIAGHMVNGRMLFFSTANGDRVSGDLFGDAKLWGNQRKSFLLNNANGRIVQENALPRIPVATRIVKSAREELLQSTGAKPAARENLREIVRNKKFGRKSLGRQLLTTR